MKRSVVFSLLFLGMSFSVVAQDDSYNTKDRKAQLSDDSLNVDVMVIPANPKLYNSFYDKQMAEANHITVYQLRDTIMKSLTEQISKAINDSVSTGIIPESKSGYAEDMDFVYDALTYSYDLIPVPKEEGTTVDKWKGKFKKKETKPEPQRGTRMENGQIVTNPETRPRYTNAHVVNSGFLQILNMRYQPKTFVLINQYEMVFATQATQTGIQGDNYPREIKVHYTIVDELGNELYSGIVIRNSSSYDDKLTNLINVSFAQIGREITQKLLAIE